MKRLHIHVGVDNLDRSIGFYSALFGAEPGKIKADYAKWMLDDPRINFAISTRSGKTGIDHLGLQVDESEELDELLGRIERADAPVDHEGETVCCYARSEKSWVRDPAGVAWETFLTMEDAELFNGSDTPQNAAGSDARPATAKTAGCCGE
ncbi:MAG: ArsI/CadI family heavy metal resistance metalloenzyme [Pseudomonadota bacterium]